MKFTRFLATTLLTFTIAGCAIPKKKPAPEPVKPVEPTAYSINLTPQELSDAFEYRDNKIAVQLEELRKQFADVEKHITKLKNEISKKVGDCLCPGEMK